MNLREQISQSGQNSRISSADESTGLSVILEGGFVVMGIDVSQANYLPPNPNSAGERPYSLPNGNVSAF